MSRTCETGIHAAIENFSTKANLGSKNKNITKEYKNQDYQNIDVTKHDDGRLYIRGSHCIESVEEVGKYLEKCLADAPLPVHKEAPFIESAETIQAARKRLDDIFKQIKKYE